ncbi:TonB-dependent receptor [Mucilaginibacter sp. AW1-3]
MPKLYLPLFIVSLFACTFIYAQDTLRTDTSKKLNEVAIIGNVSGRSLLSSPASVKVIHQRLFRLWPDNSLVTAMNTIPGVRMEERSPGSYRLSIRGSLLRSPFGIRDVKIYFDDMPLTDAGGNTYLNSVDVNSIKSIQVLKGPDGSLFGANSGGVVLLSPVNTSDRDNFVSAGLNGGSYGLIHENAAIQNTQGKNQLNVDQAYQSYDGYRANSAMNRQYVQVADRWKYAFGDQLKVLGFYSDLYYQTPGGLTLPQQEANPRSARLATPTIASAQDLKAAITNKMFYGGVMNELRISDKWRNVFALYGSNVDFTNPSFTTYEHRNEATYGLRTYFELSGQSLRTIAWKADLGLEWQQTNSAIGNWGNHLGTQDTIQTQDNIRTNQHFIFTRFKATDNGHWEMEASLSLNNYQYQFQNLYPLAQTAYMDRSFTAQLMPRLAVSYITLHSLVWRASVSRGYSTPTNGEVRATDHIINPTLQAQDGWNYETGLRYNGSHPDLEIDLSAFYYRSNNAIVMRQHPDGTSYYVNAGGANQPGLELYASYWLLKQKMHGLIRGLQLKESFTYSKFKFREYHDASNNYDGNDLTGVPAQVAVTSVYMPLPENIYLFVQHNFTAKLPLNDANTVYAGNYNLITAKAEWMYRFGAKMQVEFFAGVDNLLNQHYSLGNDLNAAGGRYYNPAALRNFFGGVNVRFQKRNNSIE